MIDYILALPSWIGAIVSMSLTTASGLVVYGIAHKFIVSYQRYDLKDPVSSLFRLLGILVSLMLSLAFSEVISEWKQVKHAIEREAVAIHDIVSMLKLYDAEGTREIQDKVVGYAQAVIDDDWPAMANDRFGPRASAMRRQAAELVIKLKTANEGQKKMRTAILADLDVISDYRIARLNHALVNPPVYVLVIVFGFLVSMACFGAYQPQLPLIVLASLYTAFIGLVLYLVMSLSDPFHGGYIIEPTSFEHLLEWLKAT